MPLYNKQNEVSSTIHSVLQQTFNDFELIIVNDGSTDNSESVAKSISDPRIKIFNQINSGVSAARNLGIKVAGSNLIAFIDADDLWHCDFLFTIIQLHGNYPDAKWFATGYEIQHPEKGNSRTYLNKACINFKEGILSNYFEIAVHSDPPVWSSAVAVTREAIDSIEGFPIDIGSGEDLLTWARLAVRYPLAYNTQSMAIFRVSNTHRQADPSYKVANALKSLLDEFPSINYLSNYLGLWYRMQAVMAMRFNESALARRCAWQALRHGPRQWRNAYTLLLAHLPAPVRTAMDAGLRRLRQHTKPAVTP
jgi:glycosyltransferase involved in cell wall biosynthesis